ncbi:hypothetical protein C8R46DRAFT_1028361 [Mycena filopes]|nr:hypothetical protein C8R46DRAFT_1028361 [Mycena filopes]
MTPCLIADTDDVLLSTLVVISVLTVLLMLLFLLWCIGEFRIPFLRTSSELEDRARFEEHFKMLAVQSLWTRSDWEKAFYEFRHKASIAQRGKKPEEGEIITKNVMDDNELYVDFEVSNPAGIKVIDVMNAMGAA